MVKGLTVLYSLFYVILMKIVIDIQRGGVSHAGRLLELLCRILNDYFRFLKTIVSPGLYIEMSASTSSTLTVNVSAK